MRPRARLVYLTVGLTSLAFLSACRSNPPRVENRGATTTAPLDKRLPSERGLASKDLVTATDEMIESIANHPEFINAPYRLQIVMDQVVNRTTMPARDFDIYLARIRARLNESGARYNLGFVLPKADIEHLRRKEGLDPAGSSDFASKADYVLRGVFYDAPSGGTNTYLLTFQIVDLHDAQITWEGSYEVKFAG
ncbi:MAG: hypothetical protein R3B46_14880 [Phycisphaerales bacterium]